MSTSSKRGQKKELPIYDPEGVDPQSNVAYEEVKVPMQEHITATRKAFRQSWNSVKEAWVRVTEDTHSSLTSVAGKARRQANTTLSSLGVDDSRLVLRGSAYAGAAITGLYLARRRTLFLKLLYPLIGAGLVGGAIHRHKLYAEYRKISDSGFQSNWSSRRQSKEAGNLEKSIRSTHDHSPEDGED